MKEFATLDKAIELAQQGYAVYPLIENTKKPPKGVAGYQAATSDQNTIFAWFKNHPAYNLGLRLDLSDLLVVDIDMHEPTKTVVIAWYNYLIKVRHYQVTHTLNGRLMTEYITF